MRTSNDMRFTSTNDNPGIRFSHPIQYIPQQQQQHSQTQNLFYQTPVGIPISPQIANGSHLNNYSLYPQIYQIPNQQIMMSGNQQLLISMPNASSHMADNANLGNISTVDSNMNSSIASQPPPPATTSLTSSSVVQSQIFINYTVSKWHEISAFYDGNPDERPSAGQLKNGKYFTQRSAGKDIYMVFNSISDYINNFVNYYFSNKNFSTDEKLFNLMDEFGSVALKDLIKFPRLAHIGTTIEDIIEALKYSNFVKIVNMKSDLKGVRRFDGWFPTKLIDDSHQTNSSQWVPISGESISNYSTKKSDNDIIIGKKNFYNASGSSVISVSAQTSMDPNVVVVSQSPHLVNEGNSHVDNGGVVTQQSPLIYFSPSNNSIHQAMYPSTIMHGIHQNHLHNLQSQNNPTGHLLAPGNPTQLILHTQPYSTFYQPNQSIHFRHFWPTNPNITDLSGNPILYTSSNNTNVRHVIGAGGNNVSSNLR